MRNTSYCNNALSTVGAADVFFVCPLPMWMFPSYHVVFGSRGLARHQKGMWSMNIKTSGVWCSPGNFYLPQAQRERRGVHISEPSMPVPCSLVGWYFGHGQPVQRMLRVFTAILAVQLVQIQSLQDIHAELLLGWMIFFFWLHQSILIQYHHSLWTVLLYVVFFSPGI